MPANTSPSRHNGWCFEKKAKFVKQDNCRILGPVYHVDTIRHLTASTFVLRLERQGLKFRAGQCVSLSVQGTGVTREYTIYSGEQDPYLDFLVKEVLGGVLSPMLKQCKSGDVLRLRGPYSNFVLDTPQAAGRKYLFIATGTGIAPFHACVRSYADLDYTLLHGVRTADECYDRADYAGGRYIACVSREQAGDFHGRVTTYVREHPVDKQSHCYLCGNRAMIEEIYELLRAQGIPSDRIFSEVFF